MTQKKTVALLIPTLEGGGAERVFVNLSNFFVHRGFIVWLLTSKGGVYFNQLDENVHIHYISKPSNTSLFLLTGGLQVANFLIRNKIDYLLCTLNEANIIGSIAKKLSFSKAILILRQARTVDVPKSLKEKVYSFLLKKSYSSVNVIIANSPETALSMSEVLNINFSKINVIGNPLYNSSMVDLSMQSFQHKWFDQKYILSIGSLRQEKGFNILITSFSQLKKVYKDIKLIILGTGPLLKDLEQMVAIHNLQNDIDFAGFVSNPYPFYKNASIFVSSSQTEGFGNVLVEALSFGVNIVSTACSGPKYILENGLYGKIVPINDVQAMTKAITETLENPGFYNRDILKKRAQDFSVSAIGEQYLELLYGK